MLNRAILILLFVYSAPTLAQNSQRVVVMTSYPQDLITRYETAFEAAHPDIDMVIEWRRSDDAKQWLQSDSNDVDVYWAPSLDTFASLAAAGHFVPLGLPRAGLPGHIGELTIDDPQSRFIAVEVAGFGFAYSRTWLNDRNLPVPHDWPELRAPHYAGAVIMPVPSEQGFAPMIYASILRSLGWDEGWALITEIAANNRLYHGRGGNYIDALAAAEYGIALSIDFFPKSAQMNGLLVDFRYANSTLFSPAYVAQLVNAPQPLAARAFIEFVTSNTGQSLLLHRDVARLPVRPDAYSETDEFNPFTNNIKMLSFNFQYASAWQALINVFFDIQISDRHDRLHSLTSQIDALLTDKTISATRQAQLSKARQQLLAPPLDEDHAMAVLEALFTGEIEATQLPIEDWAAVLQQREHDAHALISRSSTPLVFQTALPQLNASQRELFFQGRSLFNQVWVASPSLDSTIDGLGPTYNQSACSACHARNGRAAPPASERERMRGMLVRLSVNAASTNHEPMPHIVYGDQLQDAAIAGVPAEGDARIVWQEHTEHFSDGESITLRRPVLTLHEMKFGRLEHDVLLSARIAPSLVGLGLLDAVPNELIESLAQTSRPDGISGRVNRVWSTQANASVIGRFGWKANMSNLLEQSAGAFSADMGISSAIFPGENCPAIQKDCVLKASLNLDLTEQQLQAVVFYQAALAIPVQRDTSAPKVQQGQALFRQVGCHHCHIPELRSANAALPILSNTVFSPYTDLLLHDMGSGLADDRPDYLASGSEWRTPPLWGLGLVPTVNEHNTLLHDGRARGVMEAIMWHGGEAETARERVRGMTKSQREALVSFVESL